MIPAWCEDYVKTPFKEKGRTRAGFDCWGLVRDALACHFGIDGLPDYVDAYLSSTDRNSVAAAVEQGSHHGWKRVEAPISGAVVILRLAGRPWHCGLVVDDGWMLHTTAQTGGALERLNSLVWRGRVEGFYVRA